MKSQIHISQLIVQMPAARYGAFRMGNLLKLGFCIMLTVSCLNAEAAPVTWILDGVVFNDGGTANGSFVYDADTNLYSNISIETTAGTILDGARYPDFLRGSAFYLDVVPDASLTNLTGSLLLNIIFASPLTNTGGGVDIVIISEGFCQNEICDVVSGAGGRGAAWTGSVTAVPLLPAVWLFVSGFLGLISIARRKKA